MKLVDCPDVDRGLIPFFASVLAGKPFDQITDEELQMLDMDDHPRIDRTSPAYRRAQEEAGRFLLSLDAEPLLDANGDGRDG